MRRAAKTILEIGAVLLAACAIAGAPWRSLTAQAVHSGATTLHREGGVITGTVVDSLTGLALHGVTVTVTAPSGSTRQKVSDPGGHFRFDSIVPGTYIASTAHRLLDSARVTFSMAAGDSVLLTIATRGRVAASVLSAERRAQLAVLDSARARWLNLRPAAYRFQLRTECFCFPDPPRPVIEVRGNIVTIVGNDGARRIVPADSSKVYDIVSFFDFMATTVRDERFEVSGVTYDPVLAYPRTFTTESSSGATDTWVHHFIEGFELLPPKSP
jgi:hypothetical protein